MLTWQSHALLMFSSHVLGSRPANLQCWSLTRFLAKHRVRSWWKKCWTIQLLTPAPGRWKKGLRKQLLCVPYSELLKQAQDVILYQVTKDALTKQEVSVCCTWVSEGWCSSSCWSPRSAPHTLSGFFWCSMEKDVQDHVKSCQRSVLSKTPELSASTPLENIKTSALLEFMRVDFWSAVTTQEGNNRSVDVLFIMHHFNILVHAFPCRGQTDEGVARKLRIPATEWFLH